jgi:hypothetical protein
MIVIRQLPANRLRDELTSKFWAESRGSIAAPALIAPAGGVFANNATRNVTLAAADSDNTHALTHREVLLNGLRVHIAEAGQVLEFLRPV